MNVTSREQIGDRQTDHAMEKCVRIGGIAWSAKRLRLKKKSIRTEREEKF